MTIGKPTIDFPTIIIAGIIKKFYHRLFGNDVDSAFVENANNLEYNTAIKY